MKFLGLYVLMVGVCLSDDQFINPGAASIAKGTKLGDIETNFVMEILFELNINSDCSSDFCGVLLVGGSDTSWLNRYPGFWIAGPGNYLNIDEGKLLIHSDRGGSFVHETDAIFTAQDCSNNGPIKIYWYQDNDCAVLKVNNQVVDVKHGDFYNAVFYPDYVDPTNVVNGPHFNVDEPIYVSDAVAVGLDGSVDDLCIYTYDTNTYLYGGEDDITKLCS